MVKTFFSSPLAGLVAAASGWVVAILLMDAMDPATFDSLRFGWHGMLVGCVAAMFLVVYFAVGDVIELMVSLAAAAGLTAYLWNRTTLPLEVESSLGRGTPAYYWTTITMMFIVLALLLAGLRTARVSNTRARSQ